MLHLETQTTKLVSHDKFVVTVGDNHLCLLQSGLYLNSATEYLK